MDQAKLQPEATPAQQPHDALVSRDEPMTVRQYVKTRLSTLVC